MDDGIFSASKISQSTFQFKIGDVLQKELNHIALALTADLFLDAPSQSITLSVDGGTPSFAMKYGDRYEAVFTNICYGCSFDPNDPCDPKKRNDFYHYYDLIDTMTSPPVIPFELRIEGDSTINDPVPLTECLHSFSDRAPCMSVGFGQTKNFT